jgi:TolB-like protein/DNA-binding winged helix-turn-helix (wHTH) protein/Tfp pilus assembly protein PilF
MLSGGVVGGSVVAVPQGLARAVIRFSSFEVDLRAGELRRDGVKIKLQEQPFRVLALLLEHPREVVTREELRQAIWPSTAFGTFDEGIDAAIYKLRNTIGDSAEHPRFIETLPRRGYRFIAPVDTEVAPALEETARQVTAKRLRLALAAGLAALAAVLLVLSPWGLRGRWPGRAAAPRIHSLVVLPLRNLSGDATQEYFADGMTEALTTDLGRVTGLRVISSTSAMRYKGTREALPAIARQLNVDAVVEGSVLRAGPRVRITAQLVEAPTDRHLWAGSYERDLTDVLALQDEVARAITNEVRSKLSPPEERRLAGARQVNPEAYDAYLRGRYEWNAWTEQGLTRSIAYFEQAVQKDSGYAPAWAGLSDAYHLLGLFGFLPQEVALPKVKATALKAIELDETLSEAHVSLSGVRLHLEWSWSATESELRRAIALDPNNAMAHQYHGYVLSAMSRFDAAVAEMRRALELDPLSPNKLNSLAATLYRAGRYDEALRYFRAVPDPDANSETRHRRMAAIYERKQMHREAIAELLTALTLAGKRDVAAVLEREYRTSGYAEAKRAFLRADLRESERRARNPYPRPLAFHIAADYALLGERDKAFEWLDAAVRARDGNLGYLKVDDRFEALRSDPRFTALVRRLGFPP